MGFSQAEQSAQTSTSTTNTDRRLTTTSGDILNLEGATISAAGGVGREGAGGAGGTINVITSNADLAKAAIQSVTALAASSGAAVANAAQAFAQGSNKIAADVAASQEKFVATASGQKFMVYALAGVVGLLLIPKIFGKKA